MSQNAMYCIVSATTSATSQSQYMQTQEKYQYQYNLFLSSQMQTKKTPTLKVF